MILQKICRIQTIPPFIFRSSHPEVFLRKGVLKRCSKFTGEKPCRSVISIKMLCNFIEMTLWHGCSPVNFLRIFRTPFTKNISGRLLLRLHNRCLRIIILLYKRFAGSRQIKTENRKNFFGFSLNY